MGNHIYSKLLAYMDGIKLFDVLKMILILLLSVCYSKNKRRVIYMFIPLIAIVFVIGSDRVFMMGYFFIANVVKYGTPSPV